MANLDPRDALALAQRNIRPVIPLPAAGLPPRVLIGIAAILALMLFFALDARRRSILDQNSRPVVASDQPISSPPPLAVPPEPEPQANLEPPVVSAPRLAPPFVPSPFGANPDTSLRAPVPQSPAPAPSPATETAPRSDAPILAVDTTTGFGGAAPAAGSDKDQLAAAGSDEAVRATLIRNRSSLIPQGTLIRAILETPLNSTRPGLARAVVSKDALSFDGSRVLIPRGSRIIGEFQADTGADARRVLVTWTRLIRPDGVAIRIGSPAGDALGGAGIPGQVNTHFLERFSNAVLQSALTIGVNLASQRAIGNSVYVGIPGQAASIGQQLLPNINPRTTIKVRQGAEISIFVARDLDFGGTPPV